jgi:transposase
MQNLGLDVHSANFTLAHLNGRGKLCRIYQRATAAEELIEVVGEVPGPKRLVVEESHLAQWVKHVLEAYVDDLIICDPKRNRWISQDEYADDKSSARKLAVLLHGGFIKPIRHPDDVGAELRSLFLHYYNLNRQSTRFKNMLKATFRQVAIRAPGREIYETKQRQAWLAKLKDFKHLQQRAAHYFELLETVAAMKEQAYRGMVGRAKKSPAFELLQTIVGVGPVISSGYIAIIDTPYRFSRKNKLWAYACLGNKYHESDQATYERRHSKTGCRPLKWLVMQQFNAAVFTSETPNRFKRQHEALMRSGLGKRTARRHVCRTMLSVDRSVWMKGEAYRDEA